MRVVVELTQREADDLMLWHGDLDVDGYGLVVPPAVSVVAELVQAAIVKAEAFAKAHP